MQILIQTHIVQSKELSSCKWVSYSLFERWHRLHKPALQPLWVSRSVHHDCVMTPLFTGWATLTSENTTGQYHKFWAATVKNSIFHQEMQSLSWLRLSWMLSCAQKMQSKSHSTCFCFIIRNVWQVLSLKNKSLVQSCIVEVYRLNCTHLCT